MRCGDPLLFADGRRSCATGLKGDHTFGVCHDGSGAGIRSIGRDKLMTGHEIAMLCLHVFLESSRVWLV